MPARTIPAAALLSLCALSTAANATGAITCYGMDSQFDANIVLGAGPVPNVYSVTTKSGARAFSTSPVEGHEPAAIARSYIDANQISVDLVDDQATRQIVRIRVLRTEHDETGPFQVGYVQVMDQKPQPVMCDGP